MWITLILVIILLIIPEHLLYNGDVCIYQIETTALDCSQRRMTSPPSANGRRVTKLDLSQNEIILWENSFKEFEDLIFLNISRSFVLSLPDNFLYLKNLQVLDLSYNLLMILPRTVFESLPSLTTLYLSNNPHLNVELISFQSQTKLEKLFISNVHVPIKFDYSVMHIEHLQLLDLSGSTFDTLDRTWFRPFVKIPLQILYLNEILTHSFEQNALSDLTSLETLHFNKNMMSAVKNLTVGLNSTRIKHLQIDEIQYAKSLDYLNVLHRLNSLTIETLSFENNGLIKVDALILNKSPQVRNISLKGNMLEKFDFENIFYLKQLQNLDLSQNRIESISKRMSSTAGDSIQELDLSYNRLQSVGIDMLKPLNFPNLKSLNLNHNNLLNLSKYTFSKMPNLKYLHIHTVFNKDLSKMDAQIFSIPTLEFLDLSCNDLNFVTLPNDLPNLITLYLQGNNLGGAISSGFLNSALSDCPKLQNLNLSQNSISNFPYKMLSTLDNLKTLDLSLNLLQELPQSIALLASKIKKFYASKNNISMVHWSLSRWFDKLQLLDLSDNAFSCDCNLSWFQTWLSTTKVNIIDLNVPGKYKCNNKNIELMYYSTSEEQCPAHNGFNVLLFFGILIPILLIILVIFFTFEQIKNFCQKFLTKYNCYYSSLKEDMI